MFHSQQPCTHPNSLSLSFALTDYPCERGVFLCDRHTHTCKPAVTNSKLSLLTSTMWPPPRRWGPRFEPDGRRRQVRRTALFQQRANCYILCIQSKGNKIESHRLKYFSITVEGRENVENVVWASCTLAVTWHFRHVRAETILV